MMSTIKEGVAGKFCVWLLLLAGMVSSEAVAQQKIVFIKSEQDVIDSCVIIPAANGKGQKLMGPLVPVGTLTSPDVYSMSYSVEPTNRVRNLVFSFARSGKYVNFDEVVLPNGQVVTNPPFQQVPANGQFAESHVMRVQDDINQVFKAKGAKLKWRTKGKSGSYTVEIPAYFFTGFEKRVEEVLETVTKVEPASPYIQSGSIGKKVEPKNMANELSHLEGVGLIGQMFIFMPQLPQYQKEAYIFGEGVHRSKRLPYEKYVGKVVKIVAVTTDQDGNEHYGGNVEGTGEFINMTGGSGEAKLPGLALKRDIDHAREKFIGKKVWLQDQRVYTYNEDTQEVVPHAKPKFTEYKVQNVVLGTMVAPVRFILEDVKGNVFFYDVYMSRSNTATGLTSELFDYVFYDKNPREIFSDWSDEVFGMVSVGLVKQGMTKTQVTFSLGKPESVTSSELGDIKLEIWHYESKVVTFNKGLVSGIDTLK